MNNGLRATPIVLAAALAGCITYRPTPASDEFKNSAGFSNTVQLVERLTDAQAPTDFECVKDDMVFKRVTSDFRIQATGCGKRATYTFIDSIGWVLATNIEPYPQL